MNRLALVPVLGLVLALVLTSQVRSIAQSAPLAASPLGSAFTYQGQLKQNNTPVNGTCDLYFALFDDPTAGLQKGTTLLKPAVPLTNGLFTVALDFGMDAFNGEARWLQLAVGCPANSSATPLSPRQPLTPAPYALALPGQYTQQNATSPNLIGGFSGNSVTTSVVGATIGGGGQLGGTNRVTDDFGTIGGGLNNQAGNNNAASTDARYATVGGGLENEASGDSSTVAGGVVNRATGGGTSVGGGVNNTAGGGNATVAGGYLNNATGAFATVGGGSSNTATSTLTVNASVVAGGNSNTANGDGPAIGGGHFNTATGHGATVPGGHGNSAAGTHSFAAGTNGRALHDGAFVWADNGGNFDSATINQFSVRANGGARFVKGASTTLFTLAGLQVENAANESLGGEAAWLRIVSSANDNSVLKLLKHPSGNGNFLECFNSNGTTETAKCHINSNGSFVAGSDFAEALPARGGPAEYAPGDVLVLSDEAPGTVEKTTRPYDTRVAGVYSTRPAVLGADKGGDTRVDPDDVPVAVVGIVPTRVTAENGAIQPGDLLTTAAMPGHAMRAAPVVLQGIELYPPGAILGKALEPLHDDTGVIRVLVMPR